MPTTLCATSETKSHSAPAKAGRWDGLYCVLLVLAALATSRPGIEAGLIDDFSYVRTAWTFAETGQLHYYGWSAVMLSVQTVLATPFIKLFGPTYFACRLSTQVELGISLFLFHSMLRRCGLNRSFAAFGTCVLGLCPLTLATSATFMSDMCSLLLMLLCIECAFRVVAAANTARALAWLLFGFVVSIVGGTERQTLWLGGTVLLPCAAWLVRSRRPVVIAAALLWPVSILCAIWSARWYAAQPFAQTSSSATIRITSEVLHNLVRMQFSTIFCLSFLLLPVTALGLGVARRLPISNWAAVSAAGLLLAFIMHRTTLHSEAGGYIPWLTGVFPLISTWRAPHTGPIFSQHGRAVITALQTLFFSLYAYLLWSSRHKHVTTRAMMPEISWQTLTVLFVPLFGAYFMLLALRAASSPIFDRYLLPLLAFAILFLLRFTQEHLTQRVSIAAWMVAALFSYWGIAGTHDWIAGMRARQAALANLEKSGIKRTDVLAGFELDAATEIDMRGSVTNYNVPLFVYPDIPKEKVIPGCTLYHPYTADIKLHYILEEERIGRQEVTEFQDIPYRAWMPPFHRSIKALECPKQSESVTQKTF